MSEPIDPDPIEELRRSNPVDAERLPSANLARIRARVQENLMTDIQPDTGRELLARRRNLTLGIAGVVAAAAIALVVFGPRGAGPGAAPSDDGVGGGGGGGGMASCIRFDLELLAQQEVAFDGIVTAVDGESVTFAVGAWYRGAGDTITLTEPGLGGGVTSIGDLVDFRVGNRYLVSGSGGIVTSCGFSQAYDDAAAAEWAATFGS